MGITDKIQDKAQELTGQGKQAVGGATGDREMQADGLKDEKAGQLKGLGEKAKDVLK